MSYDPQRHHRRSIRLLEHDYSSAGVYFFTTCTHQRECCFGEIINNQMALNVAGQIAETEWQELAARFPAALFDAFVVMPNHLHGIIVLNPSLTDNKAPSLGQILRVLKSRTTVAINRLSERAGHPLWQRNYYEHIIRNGEVLEKAQRYILLNPERWEKDAENPIHPFPIL